MSSSPQHRPSMSSSDEVRIVVVDDCADAAATLQALLELNGYVVEVAFSAEDALLQIEAAQPHCVLLDCMMPGMNGLELAERLRGLYGDDIVLIAITGSDLQSDGVNATFGLVDHHLLKPIDFKQLSRVLPPLRALEA